MSKPEEDLICADFLNLGRPNDNIEGYDLILKKAEGLFTKIKSLTVPNAPKTSRILAEESITRVKVRVLTDNEPNGADLNNLNSGVPIKRTIQVEKIGVQSSLLIASLSLTAAASLIAAIL